jgi:hypothetical protein
MFATIFGEPRSSACLWSVKPGVYLMSSQDSALLSKHPLKCYANSLIVNALEDEKLECVLMR